jgi:dGTP triphosphohydrolase
VSEREPLRVKRIHRHLIDQLIRNAFEYTRKQLSDPSKISLDDIRSSGLPLISFEDETYNHVDKLLDFMIKNVYESPVVNRQNFRAHKIISSLCKALKEDTKLLPIRIQERINKGADETIEIALFVADLTDRSATDLYAELFEPNERSMGHFIG